MVFNSYAKINLTLNVNFKSKKDFMKYNLIFV